MDSMEQPAQQDEYQTLIQRGREALNTDNTEAALNFFQKAITLKPDCPDVLVDIGNVHLSVKSYDKAEGFYQKALNFDKNNYHAYCNLGILNHKLNNFSVSKKAFFNSLAIRPDYGPTLHGLGNLYLDLNEWDKAEEVLTTGMGIEPSSYQIRYTLAKCYVNKEEFEKALGLLEKLFDIIPFKHKWDLYFLLAEAYKGNGQIEHAIAYYLELMKNDSNAEYYPFTIASLYESYNKYADTIPYYEKCISLNTSNILYWEKLIWACIFSKNFQAGKDFAVEGLRHHANSSFLIFNAAQFCVELEDLEQAAFYFEKALNLEPENPEKLVALALLHLRQKRIDEAMPLVKKAIEHIENYTSSTKANLSDLCEELLKIAALEEYKPLKAKEISLQKLISKD